MTLSVLLFVSAIAVALPTQVAEAENRCSSDNTQAPPPPPPVVDPNPPVVDPNPPVVDPNPPVVDPNPPVVDPNPPVVDPNPPQPEMTLTSTAFDDGDPIPARYAFNAGGGFPDRMNISPEFTISNVPTGTQSLVLVMIDRDFRDQIHWLVDNISPDTTTINENTVPPDATELRDYVGPFPPNQHRYEFTLYALDVVSPLFVTQQTTEAQVLAELQPNIISQDSYSGTFTP